MGGRVLEWQSGRVAEWQSGRKVVRQENRGKRKRGEKEKK
jgi:hypothetical protein